MWGNIPYLKLFFLVQKITLHSESVIEKLFRRETILSFPTTVWLNSKRYGIIEWMKVDKEQGKLLEKKGEKDLHANLNEGIKW